ncbi:unnamed protein product [Echinostoma caproni]|uniref:EGF-like domain-containing protein n=1 Tax=Echinostoma caproni TaxID=27848 RepID=A0A183BAG9_9TREM|nr:unnamed protein product [Echinostoma caproni]
MVPWKVASGMEMCNVNMSGLQTRTETVENPDDMDYPDGQPKTKEVFIHSKCIPSLGTTGYRCQCQPPFTEDTSHPMPNCLKRTGPCDDRLCLHGTCVASAESNSTSICVCNPGYDGPQCERRADHWSVWSECLPICGTNRTRTRRRSATIRDPSIWEPSFDELASIPNKMTDSELHSYPGELIQVRGLDRGRSISAKAEGVDNHANESDTMSDYLLMHRRITFQLEYASPTEFTQVTHLLSTIKNEVIVQLPDSFSSHH